jgi:hypothetical protein
LSLVGAQSLLVGTRGCCWPRERAREDRGCKLKGASRRGRSVCPTPAGRSGRTPWAHGREGWVTVRGHGALLPSPPFFPSGRRRWPLAVPRRNRTKGNRRTPKERQGSGLARTVECHPPSQLHPQRLPSSSRRWRGSAAGLSAKATGGRLFERMSYIVRCGLSEAFHCCASRSTRMAIALPLLGLLPHSLDGVLCALLPSARSSPRSLPALFLLEIQSSLSCLVRAVLAHFFPSITASSSSLPPPR